jgi:hypothetical protein
MLRRIADMTGAGTQVIALLALSDDGAPALTLHHVAEVLRHLQRFMTSRPGNTYR